MSKYFTSHKILWFNLLVQKLKIDSLEEGKTVHDADSFYKYIACCKKELEDDLKNFFKNAVEDTFIIDTHCSIIKILKSIDFIDVDVKGKSNWYGKCTCKQEKIALLGKEVYERCKNEEFMIKFVNKKLDIIRCVIHVDFSKRTSCSCIKSSNSFSNGKRE